MPDGLFRREVFDNKNNEWLGSIRLSSPPSHWAFSSLAAAIALIAIAFLTLGHFTRRQNVTGELVPSLGLLNVTASTAGTVTQTYVHTGESVTAGEPLLALSGDVDSPAMGLIDALVIQSLQGQKSLLQQDLADQDRITSVQQTDLRDKLASLTAQLAEIQGQIGIQNEQVATTEAVLEKFNEAGTGGFVSGLQMQQQKATVFSAQAQLKQLNRDRDQIAQQIDDTRQQLDQLPITNATQLNDTQAKLADVEQSLAKTAAQQLVVLRAPAAGIVSAMIAEPGEAITAGQPVVSITPAGAQLVAQLLVPSSAIGFIHPNSRLKLRYDAFPYQEFGQATGSVTSISASALTPSEVAGLAEQRTDQPLYMVDIALDRQTISVYGAPEPLRAGLKLEASIMLDRRRLINWVIEPIYEAGHGIFGGPET
jgi:membrane fusion protein